jgi:hypothetical protein
MWFWIVFELGGEVESWGHAEGVTQSSEQQWSEVPCWWQQRGVSVECWVEGWNKECSLKEGTHELFENEDWLVQQASKGKPSCLGWVEFVVVVVVEMGSIEAVDDPMDHHSQT